MNLRTVMKSEGTMRTKLTELRDRLLATQKEIVHAAAEAGTIPSDNALRKIADLEVAIGAVEHMLEQSK
jgi:citrate lyase beta subunit